MSTSTPTDQDSGIKVETEVKLDKKGRPIKKATLASELRFYLGFIICFVLFTAFGFGHYRIPSESMQPTLEVGDRLYVSKFSYGYSRHDLPWGNKWTFLGDGVFNPSFPDRGDVVVFRNPATEVVMIKRIVGLPGDRINYTQGRISINGELIERKKVDEFFYREHKVKDSPFPAEVVKVTKYEESWPGEEGSHFIYERSDTRPSDNAGDYVVPDGHVFFTGDNRDNSTDSRVPQSQGGPGYVPLSYVIGKAQMMVLSLKKCEQEEGLRCPGSRWFMKL